MNWMDAMFLNPKTVVIDLTCTHSEIGRNHSVQVTIYYLASL